MRKVLLFVSLVLLANVFTAFAQDSENVVGKWQSNGAGLLQYQNETTGSTKVNRGTVFAYKFLPNGNYEFMGYMESTTYNCTTALFNQIRGKYTVEGSAIKLSPTRDYWKSTNSCAPGSNKEQTKTPVKKSLEFRHKTDEYGKLFICLTEGKTETCYRKEKE